MIELQNLLKQSITLYQEMLQDIRKTEQQLPLVSADEIVKKHEEVTRRIQEAKDLDTKIICSLHEKPERMEHPLIEVRRQLLEELIEANAALAKHLRSHQAVIADEMKNIQTGRKSIAGYKSNSDKTGKIVRNSY